MVVKKPTQADVARRANVSQALVSYVVSGNPHVSIPLETRDRILQAIHELGYQPNKSARTLRTSKTNTIAGIIPDILNPFYPAFQRGIQDVTDQLNFDLITYNSDAFAEKERSFCQSLLQGRADGLIAVLFHLNAKDLLPLVSVGIPVVRLEPKPKPAGSYPLDNICIDNVAASHAATAYLIGKGHARIGILAGKQGPASLRLMGYRQALATHGIPLDQSLVRIASFDEEGGYVAMKGLLRRNPRVTAVFASNDLMAVGALRCLQEAGIDVPEEIALVGFDDIPVAKLMSPALTTVSQKQKAIGQRAAEMLFERLNQVAPPGGRSEIMPFELVIRESA